jgi:hypothetical protein
MTIHGYDNNTDEFWEIEGESLHQYGWSVSTIGGSRFAMPPRRGDNQKYAYRPGMRFRPKVPDSRTLTLAMWVTGQYDLATGLQAADHRIAWNDSFDFLRRLVWKVEGRQFTLTRRWKLTVAGTPTIVTADALAELGNTMEPTMTGRQRAEFQMDLLLADPFFYGRSGLPNNPSYPNYPWTTVDVPRNLSSADHDTWTHVTVTNPGYDVAAFGSLYVDFVGPLKNPVLANDSAHPQVWVKYNGEIDEGVTIRLVVPDFLAFQRSNNHNYIQNITHSGARHWFGLLPGDNTLTLITAEGTGKATVWFRPPYA